MSKSGQSSMDPDQDSARNMYGKPETSANRVADKIHVKPTKKHVKFATSMKVLREVFPSIERGESIDSVSHQATYRTAKSTRPPTDLLPHILSAAHLELLKKRNKLKPTLDNYSICAEQGSHCEGGGGGGGGGVNDSELSLTSINSTVSYTTVTTAEQKVADQWPSAIHNTRSMHVHVGSPVDSDMEVSSDMATIASEDTPDNTMHHSFVTGNFDYVPLYVPGHQSNLPVHFRETHSGGHNRNQNARYDSKRSTGSTDCFSDSGPYYTAQVKSNERSSTTHGLRRQPLMYFVRDVFPEPILHVKKQLRSPKHYKSVPKHRGHEEYYAEYHGGEGPDYSGHRPQTRHHIHNVATHRTHHHVQNTQQEEYHYENYLPRRKAATQRPLPPRALIPRILRY